MPDELLLHIPVQEYIDREITRAIAHERELNSEKLRYIGEQFLTADQARVVAESVAGDRRRGERDLVRWLVPSLPAFLALALALYVALRP